MGKLMNAILVVLTVAADAAVAGLWWLLLFYGEPIARIPMVALTTVTWGFTALAIGISFVMYKSCISD